MSPEHEQRLEEVFSAARDLPPLEQVAFLDRACANDAELRRQADSLLAAHKAAGRFLQPTVALSTASVPFEKSGDRIGRAFDVGIEPGFDGEKRWPLSSGNLASVGDGQ